MGTILNCPCCGPGCPVTIPAVPAESKFIAYFDADQMSNDGCWSWSGAYPTGPAVQIASCDRPQWDYQPNAYYISRAGYIAADPPNQSYLMGPTDAPYLYPIFENDRAAYYYSAVLSFTNEAFVPGGSVSGCNLCGEHITAQLVFFKDGNSPIAVLQKLPQTTLYQFPLGVGRPPERYGMADYFGYSGGVKFSQWWFNLYQSPFGFAVFSCADATPRDLNTDIWHMGTEGYSFGPVKDIRNTSATITLSGGTGSFAGFNGTWSLPFYSSQGDTAAYATGKWNNVFAHTYYAATGVTTSLSFRNYPSNWKTEIAPAASFGTSILLHLGPFGGAHYLVYDDTVGTWGHYGGSAGTPPNVAPSVDSFTFHPSPSPRPTWNMVGASSNLYCTPDGVTSWHATGGGCRYAEYPLIAVEEVPI